MKKYLFFIGTLCNGGAERVVSNLASRMAEQGMDVEILMYYNKPVSYELHEKVKLTALETMTGTKNKLKNFFALRSYFRNHAKVVISFLAPFNIMAIAANFGNKVPIIVADRNDPSKVPGNPAVRKLRDFLYRFADGVVVQTKKNQEYFGKAVQKKSTVIYNPVDMKDYAGAALHCTKEKIIVTAGRLMPQKNQKMMMEAFAEILKSYPEYQLVIYGEGPSRKELEAAAESLGIAEHVLLPGNTLEIYEKIKSAEIFVLSSDYEGMPNALIEAMCLGLPVISTKVSGATDLIRHGENGLLVEVNNGKAFEEAILELLANREKAKFMAEEAVKLNELLTMESVSAQWIRVTDEIGAKR